MKRALVVTVILCVMLVGGCATSSPWAGIPYQQANEWRAIGVAPYHAKQYMQNGFTAVDAQPWIQMGINNPNTAIAWHRAGFSSKEAAAWINKNFTIQQATDFRSKGLTVTN